MESKKINQLATNVAPQTSDLTIIGDPVTGVSKKITLLQIANLFATTGTVSSVAVTETGDALTITGSPITSAGTINIGFAGDATQYVRGDGALADFPTSTGGGSSVSYYLNSSVSQGTIGGVAYRELSKDPISGAGTDITISADGYIASYITDANDPALLEVPGGNFNCEFYFSVNSNNHNPYVYAELYKYDGSTFTLLGSSQSVPEYLTNGTTLSPYYFAIPVAASALTITDRLAIRIYANVDNRIVTLHTENSHLCQVVTTFSKGLTSLNNLTRQVQFFATGTSGTDFAISSSTATHTFNLPVASATNTGKLSSTDWSTFNNKQNALTNPITGTGASGQVTFFNGTTSVIGSNNFFWDNTNSYLGIGTNTPSAGVTSFSTTAAFQFKAAGTAPAITFSNTLTSASLACVFGLATSNNHFIFGTAAGDMAIANQSTSAGAIVFGTGTTEKMRMTSAGTFSIGNTNSTFNLDVTGTGRFTTTLTANQLIAGGASTDNVATLTTFDQGNALKLKGSTGDLFFVPYFSPSIGARITAQDTAGSANTPLSFYASNFYFNTNVNFGSTIGNGTYTYTLPNATGTIALTSNLSAYLPLAGGTLTGALSGTSATFSSSVTATQFLIGGTPSNTAGFTNSFYAESAFPSLILKNTSGTVSSISIGLASAGAFGIWNNITSSYFMFFTAAQNVGIGSTNPQAKLEIQDGHLRLYDPVSTAGAGYAVIWASNNGGTNSSFATIEGVTTSAGNRTGDIKFNTSSAGAPSEKMRITSGGYFKAANDGSYLNSTGTYHEFTNNTSATATTVIRNTAGNFTDNVLAIGSTKGTNSNFNQIAAYTSDFSNIVFKVRGDGNVYNVNGVYTSGVSDIKYKEQIVDTNSQWDDIKNLRVVNFKFIKDVKENGDNALRHIGFIAQEVEKVSPNLVEEMTDNETGETWKTIKTSIIHTKAIKALQECMARIEEQQAQIEELKQLIKNK